MNDAWFHAAAGQMLGSAEQQLALLRHHAIAVSNYVAAVQNQPPILKGKGKLNLNILFV